jgi:probable rRNA maturation factor
VTEDRRRSIYRTPWRIDLTVRPGVDSPLPDPGIAAAAARALEAAGAPAPGSIAIVLTDDDELAELNHEHMGHEGATDVLSFPMLPPEVYGRGAGSVAAGGQPAPADGGRTHIGDIAISIERAIEQADQGRGGQTGDVRWSAADEVRLLVTHGVLHCCGWDHAEPAEEAEMRALERELLAAR